MKTVLLWMALIAAVTALGIPVLACSENEGPAFNFSRASWFVFWLSYAVIASVIIRAYVMQTVSKRIMQAQWGQCARTLPRVEPIAIMNSLICALGLAVALSPFERLAVWAVAICVH